MSSSLPTTRQQTTKEPLSTPTEQQKSTPNGQIIKQMRTTRNQREMALKKGAEKALAVQVLQSINGLKQSGRLQNQKLSAELKHLGFTTIKSDPAVFIMEREGVCIIMPVFVDDITITSKDHAQIVWVKESLAKVFKLKDLGPTKFLLGIQIDYDREKRTIAFSQHQYIVDILNRFKMSDCHTIRTPMDPKSGSHLKKYIPNPENPVDIMKVPYMSAVTLRSITYR